MMIPEDDDPEVTTTRGLMRASLLRRVEGVDRDDENEFTTFVEYYFGEECVHRSVHVTLKKTPAIGSEISNF